MTANTDLIMRSTIFNRKIDIDGTKSFSAYRITCSINKRQSSQYIRLYRAVNADFPVVAEIKEKLKRKYEVGIKKINVQKLRKQQLKRNNPLLKYKTKERKENKRSKLDTCKRKATQESREYLYTDIKKPLINIERKLLKNDKKYECQDGIEIRISNIGGNILRVVVSKKVVKQKDNG